MDFFKGFPQLFFDVVGRIVPGAVVLLFISLAANMNLPEEIYKSLAKTPELQQSPWVTVPILLGAAYVTAHLFGPIGNFVIDSVLRPRPGRLDRRTDAAGPSQTTHKRRFVGIAALPLHRTLRGVIEERKTYRPQIRAFIMKDLGFKEDDTFEGRKEEWRDHDYYYHQIFLYYDWLIAHAPELASRIDKVVAETVMLRTIGFGAFLSIFVHLVAAANNWSSPFLILAVVVTTLCFIAVLRQHELFQWMAIQYYYVAHLPDGPSVIAKQSVPAEEHKHGS